MHKKHTTQTNLLKYFIRSVYKLEGLIKKMRNWLQRNISVYKEAPQGENTNATSIVLLGSLEMSLADTAVISIPFAMLIFANVDTNDYSNID